MPTKEAVTEIHWCEKAVIRLGPNLTLFELCAVSASRLKVNDPFAIKSCKFRTSSFLYILFCSKALDCIVCAVSIISVKATLGMYIINIVAAIDGEADGHRSPGVRGTDLEVACVTSTFTTDPADRHILMHDAAVPARLQTGIG